MFFSAVPRFSGSVPRFGKILQGTSVPDGSVVKLDGYKTKAVVVPPDFQDFIDLKGAKKKTRTVIMPFEKNTLTKAYTVLPSNFFLDNFSLTGKTVNLSEISIVPEQ